MKLNFYTRIDLVRMAALAFWYAHLARLVLTVSTANGNATIFWIPGGLALAALLVWGWKYWPAVFVGAFAAGLMVNDPPSVSFFLATGNTLETLLAVWLFHKLLGEKLNLNQPRDFFYLALVAMVSAVVSALIGPVTLVMADYLSWQVVASNILHWWQADTLGILLGTPLFLIWRKFPQGWFSGKGLIETVALILLTLVIGHYAFLTWTPTPSQMVLGYWIFPFVVWGAVRRGQHGASLIVCIAAVQALLGAAQGKGIFAHDLAETGLQNFWFYMLILTFVGLALAIFVESRTRAKDALKDAETKLKTILNTIPDLVWLKDVNGAYLACNPRFENFVGKKEHEIIGMTDYDFFDRELADFFRVNDLAAMQKGEVISNEEVVTFASDKHQETIETTKTPVYDHTGTMIGVLGIGHDITKRKHALAEIQNYANFDQLTQLPNRRLFHDRLEQEVKRAQRENYLIALLFIDLDRFKEVNDTLGHEIGDQLLVEAATRIKLCVREYDTVARLGGDEFTVILSELHNISDIGRIAQGIIDKLTEPFMLNDCEIFISASVGIAIYPDDALSVADLIKHADQTMYAAKNDGRSCYRFFMNTMQVAAERRMRLGNDLRNALDEGQLQVYYQPIVELATGNIHKAEALLRWHHPKLGYIEPAEFIPIAEDNGTIREIGDWVFTQSILLIKRLLTVHGLNFQISVNKSPVQFMRNDRNHDFWIDELQAMQLPGSAIAVEITERLLINNDAKINKKLRAFHEAGMQVSIDDFGTGYSSLAYLIRFDIDYLKIDYSFINNLAPGAPEFALCEAIVVMAHKLGVKVIAEGVETEQQRDLLKMIKCDYVQGYLFSRPLPAEKFEALLLQNKI
jgi:diguanylate cyclase (GGDEF)-like protein/PAS domain S-box-containing protein